MNRTQTQFLELLRAGLWGTAVNPDNFKPESTNWKSITRIAYDQVVMVIVGDAIETLPKECCPPEEAILRFAMSRTKTLQMHHILNATIRQIVTAFKKQGVCSVLLKGQGVAQYYRNPMSRSCGDIDLYTGHGGYKKAVEIIDLLNRGHQTRVAAECVHHMHTFLNDIDVEIHRQASFFQGRRQDDNFQNWTKESIDQYFGTDRLETWINDDVTVALPTPTFNAFYILHHAIRHMTTESIVLRQVCDWMMLLHKFHSQIDEELLIKKLREFHMRKIWDEFSRLAVNFLGFPKDELPITVTNLEPTPVTYKLLKHILIPGNFSSSSPKDRFQSNMPYLKRKWRGFTYQTSRLMCLFKLFPDYAATYMWYWSTGALVRFILQKDK